MNAAVATGPHTLTRRLLPLQIGVALQGLILWVPIEKLFMTEIGFDAAAVGTMAAAYAAVVPLLECRRWFGLAVHRVTGGTLRMRPKLILDSC
jgi:hypothetical protein